MLSTPVGWLPANIEVSGATPAEAILPVEKSDAALAPIDPDRARVIAEAAFDADPINMRIYWPSGWIDQDDFNPATLIPALEVLIASERGWTGTERFLAAVKAGNGREFIVECRQRVIETLARDIVDRKDKAMERVRAAGFSI